MIARLLGASVLIGTVAFLVPSRRTSSLPFYQGAELTPEWIAEGSGAYRRVHRVADFALTDQQGQRITRAGMAGRIYVASFFFTECRDLCPRLRTNLTRVQDAFAGNDTVLILSHTVRPERDDTAMLARYARVNGIRADKWRLLTGTRDEIERLARDSYFVELADTTGNTTGHLLHTETLVLVDGAGRLRGVYDGSLELEVERLIEDVQELVGGRKS